MEDIWKTFSYSYIFHIEEKNIWITSKTFHLHANPDVKFTISIRREESGHLSVKVTKLLTKSAIAIIGLAVANFKKPVVQFHTQWKNDVLFEDFPIPINCDVCPKVTEEAHNFNFCELKEFDHEFKISLKCFVNWLGFTDEWLQKRPIYNTSSYFNNTEFSDIKIIIKNKKEISAHKIILAAGSTVFDKMITVQMKESTNNQIDLSDFDSDTVTELLYFLYHGTVDKAQNNWELLSQLVQVADLYCVSRLKRVCEILLANLLSDDNYIELLYLSTQYDLHYLNRHTLFFIQSQVKIDIESEITSSDNYVFESEFQDVWVTTEDLYLSKHPDIQFNISMMRDENDELHIKFTKLTTTSAMAVLQLAVANSKLVYKCVNDWTQDILFDDFIIPVDCDACTKVTDNPFNYCKVTGDGHKYMIPISFSITWYGYSHDFLHSKVINNTGACLNNLYRDLIIKTNNDAEFPANKTILGANSLIIKNLIVANTETFLTLAELDSETAENFLYFIHHGHLKKDGDNDVMLSKLVKAADAYDVAELKKVCDVSLTNHITLDNYSVLLNLSQQCSLSLLKKHVLIFISNNLHSLCLK